MAYYVWDDSTSAWVTASSAGFTSSPLTTKGDVWGYSTTDARIPVGTDGDVLTADSTQALGLKWAAGGGGGVTSLDSITGAVSLVAGSNITITDNSPSAGDISISSSAGTGTLAADRKELTSGDVTWTATSFTDISSSLDITLSTGAHRCLCAWTLMAKNTTAGGPQMQVDVDIDGTRQGQTFGLVFSGSLPSGVNANLSGSFLTSALTAGSHTFKLMFRIDSLSGTTTIYASTSVAPIVFSVVELYA